MAEVLFGDYNPGGKLAVSFPKHVGQLPVYYYHRHVGQRYVELDGEPLYPFGWGLSYTAFAYRGIRLARPAIGAGESTEVMVEVANTGPVAGDDVAGQRRIPKPANQHFRSAPSGDAGVVATSGAR